MFVSQHIKSFLQWFLLSLSVVLIGLFLYFSNNVANSLGQEEDAKMKVLASAYKNLILAEDNADISHELEVMKDNTTIPVFFTEVDGTMLGYSNIHLPFYVNWGKPIAPEDTIAYLQSQIPVIREDGRFFEIEIAEDWVQYLYYDESVLLQRLHFYPYVQLMAILVLALLFYFMIVSRKRAEQNRVWVGLSKETAHQLGTPIQSLMGWVDYFKNYEGEGLSGEEIADEVKEAAAEMDKDIKRLHVVADRFSKIGSEPKLETIDLVPLVEGVAEYMQKRASQHISIHVEVPDSKVEANVCGPLFSWVIENLCKNAIDAQNKPEGRIEIKLWNAAGKHRTMIEVSDNGKGIDKKHWKTVFAAGYTTKQRGWGLGLALVKRIVEEYHHGRIYVKQSVVGQGTTFRIEI